MLFRCCTFSLQPYGQCSVLDIRSWLPEKKIVSISFHSRAFETLEGHETSKTESLPSFLLCRFYCTLYPACSSNRQWNFEILLAVCIVNCTKSHMITHHNYAVRGVILVKLDTPVDNLTRAWIGYLTGRM